MKKLFFTLCALCLCGTMWATPTNSTYWADDSRPTDASAIYQDETSGLYFYVNTAGNAVITYINDSYDTSSSTSLDNSTWTSGYENSGLTSLIIPEYVSDGTNQYPVTMIGRLAFFRATNFEGSLTVPSYITELGSNAFEDCTGITEVIIEYYEEAITETNNQLYGCSFYGCSGIKTITVNRDITVQRDSDTNQSYRVSPFTSLIGVTTVNFGVEVTKVPRNMCYGCANITSVNCYARTVPSLGTESFNAIDKESCTLHVCKSLLESYNETYWATQFSIITNDLDDPDLEEGTYQDVATGLFFEINEDGIASIYHDELGVYDNNNLVAHSTIANAYTLPETVSADGETYYNVTRVEAEAFANSSISGHLVVPAHILNMGADAFAYCTDLTEVTYEYGEDPLYEENTNNGGDGSFSNCTGITTVNLYRDIYYSAGSNLYGPFVWQNSITTVNIGPRVTEIPAYMFRDHNSASTQRIISTINCYALTPPTTTYDPFADIVEGCVVNVPAGLVDTYAAASYSPNSNSGATWGSYFGSGNIKAMSDAFAITTHANNEGTAYATFYNSASDVELFDDGTETELTAYVAYQLDDEGADGLYIEIESIGNTVPAGTGVIVESEDAGTYLAIANGDETVYSGDNDLYGYDSAQTITEPADCYYYLLSSYNGEVGFYWGAQDGGAFQCQAHRAYLALPTTAVTGYNAISIRKGSGEDTTGISSVEIATEGASVKGIYTIQGVRVSNMNQPGLYIVDGKKVLVK